MTDETTLLPCPFCPDGGKPYSFVEDDGYKEYRGNVYRGSVGCSECGMGIEMWYCDDEIPDEWWKDGDEDQPSGFLEYLNGKWNRRYTDDDLRKL